MAFVKPIARSLAELINPAIWNQDVVANTLAMGPHLIARKTADETISSTTIQNDDHLFTPSIAASEVWWLEWRLWIISVTGAFRAQFAIPSGVIAGSSSGITGDRIVTTTSGGSNIDSNNTVDGVAHIIKAQFTNGATPGAVTLQWCASAASSCTFKINSTLWGVQLA